MYNKLSIPEATTHKPSCRLSVIRPTRARHDKSRVRGAKGGRDGRRNELISGFRVNECMPAHC